MSSFFGKLKSNNDSRHSNAASPAKSKADPNAPQPTPLERMLEHAGPLRNDGSDKFWGMENFGNTCYCNSILQALYYSVPFRENIISYPQRSSPDSIAKAAANAPPRPKYPQQKSAAPKPNVVIPQSQQKAEDKDSPEYKKKQALLAGPILNMSYQNASSYAMPDSLYSSVKDIFEAVVANQSRHGIISPSKLVEVLRRDNEMFRGQLHQDAHEFFNLLLNTLLDSIDDFEKKRIKADADAKKLDDPSESTTSVSEPANDTGTVSFPSLLPVAQPSPTRWLRDMFEGTLTSETRCLTCENVSQRDEPFLDLSVDLEQHTSVTSCLRRFSEEEMLCERNKFHCDNCGGLQEAEKRMKIKSLPKVLTLHLKRFKYTEDFGRLQKLFHKVVYPYHLRLFNTTDDADDPDRIYELYAVVVHIGGGPFHGHYVAVVKTQDRGWLLFDDEMVEPVDKSYVKNFFGDKPGLATAYVLFYQETTVEAIRAEQRREGKRRPSQTVPNEAKEAAELHQVRSVSPLGSPMENGEMKNLDHALTAPPAMNGHIEPPKTPSEIPPAPIPLVQAPQSKKEKSKLEKEQKAAAKAAEKAAKKEKEREEKEKRAALHERLGEAARQNAEQMRWAMEESKKMAKDEAARRGEDGTALDDSTNAVPNGAGSAMDNIFRRSKSLRFGSIGKAKDKNKPVLDSEDHKLFSAENRAANESAIDESSELGNAKDKDGKEKDVKKNRFSLRKKSFGLLHS